MVFQNYALFPHMNVRQNIGFGLEDARHAQGRDRAQGRRGAGARAPAGPGHKLPGQLSGGQQQRVAIARAIVIEPPLVLMDEPLSNLDAKLRLEMRAEIRRIHNELGATTIYVTHDQDEALSLADRIVVMRDGVIRQVGTPKELYERPAHLDVARFHGVPQHAQRRGRSRRRRPARSSTSTARELGGIARGELAVGRRRASPSVPTISMPSATGGNALKATVEIDRISRPRIRRLGARPTEGTELYLPLATTGVHRGEAVRLRRRSANACSSSREPAMSATADAFAARPSRRVPLRQRLAARGLDGVTLLVVPAVLFMLAAVRLSVPLRPRAVVRAEGRRPGSPITAGSSPIRSSTTPSPRRCGWRCPSTLLNLAARGADRVPRAADAAPAAADDDPGPADHARHRAGGRRAAELSRARRAGSTGR